MEESHLPESPAPPVKRTMLLTVLCILTFIGSGMNVLSSLMISVFHDTFTTVAADIAERYDIPGMDMILEARPVFFWLSTLFSLLSFSGAYLMWNLKRAGFHMYTVAQILLIISPMYFFRLPGPSLFDLIFSGIFIILYSIHLKNMTS